MKHYILFLLGLNQVFSWDLAILYNDKIELYDKQKINKTISNIAYDNMYVFIPSYKRESFSFFISRYGQSTLLTYRLKYNRYDLDGKVEKEGSIQSMDIDVNKNLLFWMDINKKALFNLEIKMGQDKKSGIFLTNFTHENVRDIVVDDVNERVYWIASNVSHSFLIRTNYIGFEQDVLVTQKGGMYFLTIDKEEGFLYWAYDVGRSYDIERYNINTGEIHIVKKNLQNRPCYLKVSKKYLFWMDLVTRYIWKSEKNNDFMATYLRFADNIVSFVINENTINNEVKENAVTESSVNKNIIITSTEKLVGDIMVNKTSNNIEEEHNDKLNETQYKKYFNSPQHAHGIKKKILLVLLIVLLSTIFIILLLFILLKVRGKEFYGELNTNPLNDI